MIVNLSEDLDLRYEDFKDEGLRVGILARSGAGKSNLAALFAESALDDGWQVVIIAPISEWHTLKAVYPQVVVCGGEYADLPMAMGVEDLLVDLLEKSSASIVVNVSDIEEEWEQKKLVGSFLWKLYRRWQRVRRPILVVLEEADIWAPQMWSKEDKPSLSRVSMLAKHGRKLGINLILISQRPADLHKSPLSQCNILFFGSFKSAQDLSPQQGVMWISKKLGIPITEKEITSLKPGEFIGWMKNGVVRFKARWRKTPHGGETPSVSLAPPPEELKAPLDEVRSKISELVEKRKRELREIDRLRRENEQLKKIIEEYERKIEILKTVKEIPLEIKAKLDTIKVPIQTSPTIRLTSPLMAEVPDPVRLCPHPGAYDVYSYLSKNKGWKKISEISSKTGLSVNRVRRVVKYLARKGVLNVRWGSRGGKKYPAYVRLKS